MQQRIVKRVIGMDAELQLAIVPSILNQSNDNRGKCRIQLGNVCRVKQQTCLWKVTMELLKLTHE